MLLYCEPKMEMQKNETVEWRIEKGRRVKYIQRAKRNVYLWLTFFSCISGYKITSCPVFTVWFIRVLDGCLIWCHCRSLSWCVSHTHKYTHTFSTSCAFNFICSLAPFMSKQNILIKCANGMCGHGRTNEQVSEMNDYAQFMIIPYPYAYTHSRSEEAATNTQKLSLALLVSLFPNFSSSSFASSSSLPCRFPLHIVYV